MGASAPKPAFSRNPGNNQPRIGWRHGNRNLDSVGSYLRAIPDWPFAPVSNQVCICCGSRNPLTKVLRVKRGTALQDVLFAQAGALLSRGTG